MLKKLFISISLLISIISIVGAANLFSRSATAETKVTIKPEACICSTETLLTMSTDLQEELECVYGKKYKEEEKILNSIYRSLFNCTCGKSQCVISTTTRGLNSVSCIKKGFL